MAISHGISMRQGSHQVAQKFRKTTLPFKSERATSFPLRSLNFKSGAGLPARAVFGAGVVPNFAEARVTEDFVAWSAYQVPAISAATARTTNSVFFMQSSRTNTRLTTRTARNPGG